MFVEDDSPSDGEQLIANARDGDQSAIAKLLEADRDYLLLVARSELDSGLVVKASESDVVQESLLEAQQSFADFRGETRAQWKHWLQTILRNNIRDIRRRYVDAEKRDLRKERNGLALSDETDRVAQSPSSIARRNEQQQQLLEAIELLPEHYQQAVRLRFWDQLSYEDMARQMDSTPEAVRKVLYRAVEAIAENTQKDTH